MLNITYYRTSLKHRMKLCCMNVKLNTYFFKKKTDLVK